MKMTVLSSWYSELFRIVGRSSDSQVSPLHPVSDVKYGGGLWRIAYSPEFDL
jgi:hypothetical protein